MAGKSSGKVARSRAPSRRGVASRLLIRTALGSRAISSDIPRALRAASGRKRISVSEEKWGEGTSAFDRPIPWLGRWVRDVRIAFDGGRLTKFSASENEDFIRADWEEAKGPKDLLGYLDVGLNPKARSGFL